METVDGTFGWNLQARENVVASRLAGRGIGHVVVLVQRHDDRSARERAPERSEHPTSRLTGRLAGLAAAVHEQDGRRIARPPVAVCRGREASRKLASRRIELVELVELVP